MKKYPLYKNSLPKNSKKKSPKKQYIQIKKHSPFYVILDLDETIISSTDREPKIDTTKYKIFKIGYLFEKEMMKHYVVVRPHFEEFIKTLKDIPNIKICIWTSGAIPYAKSIVTGLEKIFNMKLDLDLFIARKMIILNDGRMGQFYHNIYKNKTYYDTPKIIDQPIKDLSFLFINPDFKGKYNPYNTLLIDDLNLNIQVNSPKNVIWINPWTKKYPLNDTSLKTISKWFEKHRNRLDNFRALLLPKFKYRETM